MYFQNNKLAKLTLILPIFPLFPVGVFVRYSENFSHEPSAQSSLILSRVRDPFLKLDNKGTKKSVSNYAINVFYFTFILKTELQYFF